MKNCIYAGLIAITVAASGNAAAHETEEKLPYSATAVRPYRYLRNSLLYP